MSGKENLFAFFGAAFHPSGMTQPLALLLYEKLLPGSQLANRLRDMKYRVQTIGDATALVACARQDRPLITLVDLVSSRQNVSAAIRELRESADTRHIPVIAFAAENATELQQSAREAGATLAVAESAILTHLDQFLEQALHIE